MSAITQSQITEDGKAKMFAAWDAAAPQNPRNGGWFDSMMSCTDEEGQYYSCPIKDYDEEGGIVQVGGAQVRMPSLEYREYNPA